MNKLIVLISEEDDYSDRAEKIKNTVNKSDFYFIEKLDKNKLVTIFKNNILFFLTNSSKVYDVFKLINDLKIKCRILNYNFLNERYNKLEVQNKLNDSKVLVPEIYEKDDCIKFPVFVKSKTHTNFIIKVFNKKTLNSLNLKLNNNYYLEESVDFDKKIEYKIYFVNNSIFYKDKISDDYKEKILLICKKISNVLDIDIFSTDIIGLNSTFYVIDINPAPGLWNSDEARLALGDIKYE